MASVLTLDLYTETGLSTLPNSLLDLCASFLDCLNTKGSKLLSVDLTKTIGKINVLPTDMIESNQLDCSDE